jgi:hypothetical protein
MDTPQRSPEMMEDRQSVSNVNVEDNQAEAEAAPDVTPMPLLDMNRTAIINSLLGNTYSPEPGRQSRRSHHDEPPRKVQAVNLADSVNPATGSFRHGEGRVPANGGVNW